MKITTDKSQCCDCNQTNALNLSKNVYGCYQIARSIFTDELSKEQE